MIFKSGIKCLLDIKSYILVSFLVHQCYTDSKILKDVTSKVFDDATGLNGVLAAYGDINNDKITDLFAITGADKKNVSVLLGGKDISVSISEVIHFENTLSSIAPADFNNDGFIDLLVTYQSGSNVMVKIVWGLQNGKLSKDIFSETTALANQPLLLDADGDMIIDLFVTLPDKKRQFWISPTDAGKNWTFVKCDFKKDADEVEHVHSNAVLDLTGDGVSNLVLSSTKSNSKVFEVWKGSEQGLGVEETQTYTCEQSCKTGQSAFADIDGDGMVDHLLPVCEGEQSGSCEKSKILMYVPKKQKWVTLFESEENRNFVHTDEFPITLVLGDYDQDNYVDVLCIMKSDQSKVAVVLSGGYCNKEYCKEAGRMFYFDFAISSSEGAILASFYDLYDDGQMDILVSVERSGLRRTLAFGSINVADVSFLVVKVLPSFSDDRFPNVYGACVSYATTNIRGGNQLGYSCQLTQSAYFALQLPYISFGLGRLPNYVDSITVTLPTALIKKCTDQSVETNFTPMRRTWTMIIPNSQLFIKPYPLNDPDRWRSTMLVSPGKNVIATAAVLLCTCALVGVAIFVLHCLERRDDLQEKIKDSQRFHFDAM